MTVGLTSIEVGDIIERALARAGVQPQDQTPDAVFRARQNLSLQLARMASVGLYPWQIVRRIIQTVAGQSSYLLPIGTIDLVNIQRRSFDACVGVDAFVTALQRTFVLTTPGRVVMVGVTVVAGANGLDQTLTIETSNDSGATWKTRATTDEVIETGVRWFEIDGVSAATTVRATLTGSGNAIMTALQAALEIHDVSIGQLNRDDWAGQPNKTTLSLVWNCYFFDKQARPLVWLWQTPQDGALLIWVELQHQGIDIPELFETIDLPVLHIDGLIDQLALRLAKELPNAKPPEAVKAEAVEGIADNQSGAADGNRLRIMPSVRRYTR